MYSHLYLCHMHAGTWGRPQEGDESPKLGLKVVVSHRIQLPGTK